MLSLSSSLFSKINNRVILSQRIAFSARYSGLLNYSTDKKNDHNDTHGEEDGTSIMPRNTLELSDEEIRDFVPYVGKKSKYSRRIISYYLKQRKDFKLLKRSSIDYKNITTDLKFEKLQKSKSKKFDSFITNEILKILNEIVDVEYINSANRESHLPKSISIYTGIGLSKKDFKDFDNYHYYKDVPQPPEYFTPDQLEKYVHFLTHCNIYHKNSSRSNGLVPKLLTELINVKNPKTCHLISNINIINDLIFFYSKKNDLKSMLESYSLIDQLKVSPDIKTFNLLLNVINYYRQLPHNFENANNLILKYLNLIKLNNLKPNLTTVNMIYKSLPDSTSKILLLEFLENKKIKLNKTFVRCIISDLSNKLDILKLIDFLKNDKTYNFSTIDLFSFNAILNKYLKSDKHGKDKLNQIWKFYLSYIHIFKPHISHLNLFLNNLKEQPVLSMTMLNHFQYKFHVTPDIQSYYLLIRNTVKAGYSKNWRQVLRIICQEAFAKTNGNIMYHASYWLLRARSFSLTDTKSDQFLRFKEPLTEDELKLKARIIKHLVIDDDNTLYSNFLQNPNEDYKETALQIQSINKHKNNANEERLAKNFNEENNKQLSIHSKRRHYLKLIKHQTLMNVYRKRIQTLKLGPREMLQRELSQRSS